MLLEYDLIGSKCNSKSKTADVKHSITNVFHSLNEYLNTDISSSTPKVQLLDTKENYFISNDNNNTSFLQNNSKKVNTTEDISDKLNSDGDKIDRDEEDRVATLLDLKLTEDGHKVDVTEEKGCNDIENLLDLENDIVNNVDASLSVDEVVISNKNNLLDVNNTNASSKDILGQKEAVDNVKEEVRDDLLQVVKIDDRDKENVIKPQILDETIRNGTEVKVEEIICEVAEIAHEKSINEESQKLNVKEVVSFEDGLDIDDAALNQYLDELEEEYQETTVEDEGEKVEAKIVVTEEEIVKAPVKVEDIELEKDVVENVPVVKEIEDTPIKESVIPSVNVSESVTVDEMPKEIEISEEIDQKDTESVSSMERPKMLELSVNSVDEAPKREINLIGNPGSTPYNNVYISKELQTTSTQKAQEKESSSQDESETSPSVSPTFSEASTEVLTDSTETESEDDDEKTDLHAQRQKEEAAAKKAQIEGAGVSNTKPAENTSITNQKQSNAEEVGDASAQNTQQGLAEVLPVETSSEDALPNQTNQDNIVGFWLGKEAPLWIPDSDALSCLHCDARFTVIKRRHHCRACGLVLCSKCCNLKYRLEYLDAEARVCSKCYAILNMDTNSSSGSEASQTNSPNRQPNPNNPMEYCSVVPPMQQVGALAQNPPTVMVPVGVLKRKGSAKGKSNKSVMFCDGIRPGSDLTKLDTDFNYNSQCGGSSTSTSTSTLTKKPVQVTASKTNRNVPMIDPQTKSFIPSGNDCLPPTVTVFKSDITYIECINGENIVETLKCEKLTFALQRNLHVHVKIINMDCCINKKAWCFSTEGLISVGQDEIVYVIELMEDEKSVPVDVFHHINSIYNDAVKGTTVTEMGLSLHNNPNFLGFKNHAGFLYIRPSFQCLQNLIRPSEPYLVGLLIHRWETPWAKIFPLRLVLRLGAEYRYYPSPIISTRHRDSVFVEIGHTIINILADFRNFSYTLPNIKGLTIHMEDKNTTVTIPENRYDQVMKSINDSSDHTLAFGGNFSAKADSHLVCVQDTQASSENSYTTHAINILNKPRKVTGASFIVFNGALKTSSGLTAKSSIIEDGLMIQIPSENLSSLKESLRNMKNFTIQCGCINAPSDETVNIVWGEPDANFNIGVTSPIDNESLSGVPSIRVHNGKDFICNSGNRLIRWTEVFILQNTDEQSKQSKDPIDISKISESISKATCQALVKYLDLLTSNNFYKIGIRTMLHVENVSYSAGSNNIKLPPIYMKNLDNELIPILHRITSNNLGDNAITLELIFRILNT
ncbi:zinc finger fyve domain-containing protein [Holotrichia oblita]|uniref:Zinc finger fyve domain-containing protein n=1 Tax=Holotrichia oblita TaxID=644536 RepID=A0ACB9ST81_HOLOL|nr:zinc finger fyve domain-containing protein [Holotrichia oblita]